MIELFHGTEISVVFYGHAVVLKREWANDEFRAHVRLVDEEDARQGIPCSRSLSLIQAGSMNRWCARFAIRTPAVVMFRVEAWDDEPQSAVDKLVELIGLCISKVGWS